LTMRLDVHRFTRLYMGAIAPFRRLVVYPAVLRTVQSAWAQRYGGERCRESVDRMNLVRTLYAIAPNHSTQPTAFDRSISRAFAAQRTNSGQRLKIGAFVW